MDIIQYLIVCPLVFLAGFVDAVAGGGGLISLPAYMLVGVPVHNAIATNKMSSCMGTSVAAYRYYKSGYIRIKQSALCAVFALCGSWAGARLALLIADGVFKVIMLVILPLTAVYVLRSKTLESGKEPFSPVKTALISAPVALIIGAYDGFYGPGTGTFLMLLLTGAARLTLNAAAGSTKVINLTTNVTALTVFLFHGKVLLPLGIAAGCFSIAGNFMGARFFSAKGARSVKPIIIVVLSIFFIRLLLEIVGG